MENLAELFWGLRIVLGLTGSKLLSTRELASGVLGHCGIRHVLL